MRYFRVLVVLGLIAAMAAGGVALASAPSRVPRARPAAATVSHAQLRQALQSVLRHFPGNARSAVPRVLAVPGGQTCFVSGCSEVPCVIPVQASSAVAIVASGAVAQPPVAGVPTPRSRVATAPSARTLSVRPVAPNQACPGGKVASKTLRVSGP